MPSPVKFNKPPVVEVVCGVQFSALEKFRVHHFGLFWQEVRGEFPNVEERPPLPTQADGGGEPRLILTSGPLPRAWMLDFDRKRLLQLQKDRFIYNWRRNREEAPYPSFEKVYAAFENYYARFLDFARSSDLEEPVCTQYEMTYVNHIGPWNGLNEIGEEFLFVDHRRENRTDRFLPAAEAINWRSTYELPENWGRLNVAAQTAFVSTDEKVVRLDLAIAGFPGDKSEDARRKWFGLAHEWITRGFVDCTADSAHKIWERTS